jgi:hypothetical protein
MTEDADMWLGAVLANPTSTATPGARLALGAAASIAVGAAGQPVMLFALYGNLGDVGSLRRPPPSPLRAHPPSLMLLGYHMGVYRAPHWLNGASKLPKYSRPGVVSPATT